VLNMEQLLKSYLFVNLKFMFYSVLLCILPKNNRFHFEWAWKRGRWRGDFSARFEYSVHFTGDLVPLKPIPALTSRHNMEGLIRERKFFRSSLNIVNGDILFLIQLLGCGQQFGGRIQSRHFHSLFGQGPGQIPVPISRMFCPVWPILFEETTLPGILYFA
jgi:hypothetical protein